MTAAHLLGAPCGIDPFVAGALMLYLDVASVEPDTPESAAICDDIRKLISGMTSDQASRLRSIVHALHGPNKWMH